MMRPLRRITNTYFRVALRQYGPLIHKLAFRIAYNATQVEELKVQAESELLKCMICYDGSGSFMTFFYGRLTHIFRHIMDTENRMNREQNEKSDLLLNIVEPNRDMDTNFILQECEEYLTTEEYSVIVDMFMDFRTIREISSRRQVVPSAIYRIKNQAIERMRKRFKVEF